MAPKAQSKKKKPVFRAQVYDLTPGERPRQHIGVEALDTAVYLPPDREYRPMKPRVVSLPRNRKTVLRLSGVALAADDEQVAQLCVRLVVARYYLVEYVRSLAMDA